MSNWSANPAVLEKARARLAEAIVSAEKAR